MVKLQESYHCTRLIVELDWLSFRPCLLQLENCYFKEASELLHLFVLHLSFHHLSTSRNLWKCIYLEAAFDLDKIVCSSVLVYSPKAVMQLKVDADDSNSGSYKECFWMTACAYGLQLTECFDVCPLGCSVSCSVVKLMVNVKASHWSSSSSPSLLFRRLLIGKYFEDCSFECHRILFGVLRYFYDDRLPYHCACSCEKTSFAVIAAWTFGWGSCTSLENPSSSWSCCNYAWIELTFCFPCEVLRSSWISGLMKKTMHICCFCPKVRLHAHLQAPLLLPQLSSSDHC